jgi:outer membrane protein assembly factor BamB
MHIKKYFLLIFLLLFATISGYSVQQVLDKTGTNRGYCLILGDPNCDFALQLANGSEFTIYVQLIPSDNLEAARRRVDSAGLYGTRIYVDQGPLTSLHFSDNLADVVVEATTATGVPEAEILRILRPNGIALLSQKEMPKPYSSGMDDWSHLYHGPDNNPYSKDTLIKAPHLTQFITDPRFGPYPQATVSSFGRVFKALGHVAIHAREEAWLNTLVAMNGFNGTILWTRPLTPGIMVHRSTIIATPDVLYLGDTAACKFIDTRTGALLDEYVPPITGNTFWKWMGLKDSILYALIGKSEPLDPVEMKKSTGHGWGWGNVSDGFDQSRNPWGFGRTVIAVDLKTKDTLWTHVETDSIDSRAICMNSNRLFLFNWGQFLVCLDRNTGNEIWRKTPANAAQLFSAIGPYSEGQLYETTWRTMAYLKCSDQALYFSGTRTSGDLVAVSAADGSILWRNAYSNFHLVLTENDLYAICGPYDGHSCKKFNPMTGAELADYQVVRRACTRATGCRDAVWFRGFGGSVRLDLATGVYKLISPMRPDCMDGTTMANGHLYFWSMMCDCNLSVFGTVALSSAGSINPEQTAIQSEHLVQAAGDLNNVAAFADSPNDWPTLRKDNARSNTTGAIVVSKIFSPWTDVPGSLVKTTSPVTANGYVFLGQSDGAVVAISCTTGVVKWKAYTGGEIRFPPTLWKGRAYVGSGDGWIYCFEAATGRHLWKFRAASIERRIPVFGSLISNWPAASGILVEDSIAYAAAGIVNYDGTRVYALNAVTGQIKWQNNTSGRVTTASPGGVSVQGHLLLHNRVLYLAGGNLVSPGAYDIDDGTALRTSPITTVKHRYGDAGDELYLYKNSVNVSGKPLYADPETRINEKKTWQKTVFGTIDNKAVFWITDNNNNDKIMCYDTTSLNMSSLPGWATFPSQTPKWQVSDNNLEAIAIAQNSVVAASGDSSLKAYGLDNGAMHWQYDLPAKPLRWGLSVDRDGRVVVSLLDGRVLGFTGDSLITNEQKKQSIKMRPDYFLGHSEPNPFNRTTQITYALKHKTKVNLSIYNIQGRLVRTLINEIKPWGRHSIVWNGRDDKDKPVESGFYTIRIATPRFVKAKKIMLAK